MNMFRTLMKSNLFVGTLLLFFSLPSLYAFFHPNSINEKRSLTFPSFVQKQEKIQDFSLAPQSKKGRDLTMRVSSHNNGKFPGGNSILSQNVNNMKDNDQPSVVYVANLPYAATVEEIEQFFSSCGPVVDVKIIRDQYTKRSKGYCFIKFSEAIHATVAIEQFNGKDFMGRAVTCRPAFRSGGYTSSRNTDDSNDSMQMKDDDFEMNDTEFDVEVEEEE